MTWLFWFGELYDGTVIREDEPLPDKYRQQQSEVPGKLWRHAWHCTDRKCNSPLDVKCRCNELREPIPAPVAESTP